MNVDPPHMAPISRVTVTDEIVKRLTSLILDQSLKPGDKLPSERELMARLSVGRSSLRESIKVLTAVGAVEVSVGEGMFVSRGHSSILSKPLSWGLLLGERSAGEVIEARRMIEVELAGRAAERATDEEIQRLGEQLRLMAQYDEDGEAYSGADVDFHMMVAKSAHNRVLCQVLETLRHMLRAWIQKNISGYEGKPQSLNEHAPIYEAIVAGDAAAASNAMSVHLGLAGGRLLSVVSRECRDTRAAEMPDGA